MNLQRREEIRVIAECPNDRHWAQEMRRAVAELLAHIDALEQTAAERVIADGSRGPTPDYTGEGSAWVPPVEAQAVVVPLGDTFTLDLDEFGKSLARITINSKNRGVGYQLCGTMGDGHFSRRTFDITPYLGHCLNLIGIHAIPADRVPGEGVVALRRFAERCAQRDHQPDEHIGRAKCVACEAEDALRANQGGAAT